MAYYVEWHMRQALAPLLFDDEELEVNRKVRDAVAPAKPSASARRRKVKRLNGDRLPVHRFETLLQELGTRCRNRCRMKSAPTGVTLDQITEITPLQKRVAELLGALPVGEH